MPLQATSGAASYDAFGGGAAAVPTYIEDVFSTYLFTGTGSNQTITNNIDLSTKGGLVWTKCRSTAQNNSLVDTVRGGDVTLVSDTTAANDFGSGQGAQSFTSTGYVTGGFSARTYVSWTFREQPKFFDVVTYTGNGAAARAISHNLGSTPGCMIVKRTDAVGDWRVYHRGCSTDNGLVLNDTAAQTTSAIYWFGNEVNVIPPTSTQFTVNAGFTNTNGGTYVAYLFAHDAGGFGLAGTDNVISCGSYTGNGSATTGPYINLGYEPQWLLLKSSSNTQDWYLFDTMRGLQGGLNASGTAAVLYPNGSYAEGSANCVIDSTGFRPGNVGINTSAATYIYIAIRRGPMKVPTLGTSVFKPMTATGDGNSVRSFTGVGFPPDLVFPIMRASPGNHYLGDRLRGSGILKTTATDAEDSGYVKSYDQDGWTTQADSFGNSYGYAFIDYLFRRAPGFFDEVCWTGNNSANQRVSHNLGVAPELIIYKGRNKANYWRVYFGSINTYIQLDAGVAAVSGSNLWGSSAPTTTDFGINCGSMDLDNFNAVGYLFATAPGVSKVGTYTGTATTKQIDCGFTGGARFVLIKRTDSTGDWYVWDSARGIVAGNDPYLLLNSTAAEVTSTDYVDTYSAGFEISSTAPAAINASGGTFIFLAIA